uniref:Glycoside hydrolase family 28 protein n=1 Tax=Phaedon cochleariae TaxID=80249 RepID=K7DWA0_PHACE|nr:glycoside hydrolase family 28 protein [Phaedon cochleariae]
MASFALLVAFLASTATIFAKSALGDNCTIYKLSDAADVTANCDNIVVKDIQIDAGQTLQLFLKDAATLTFQGTITFDYAEWLGPAIWIKGNALKVQGAKFDHLIDGRGAYWWDGLGGSGKQKPLLMKIEATGGSVFNNIHLKNCPQACVGLENSDSVTLTYWDIDIIDGNPANGKEVGVNTDGFYIIDSSNVKLLNSTVRNQDNCVRINQGSNMSISNLYCYGGRGIGLIAGLSKTDIEKNTIKDISLEDIMVLDAKNGIQVKTISDAGKGNISNIYFKNIRMANIREIAVNVEQDVVNGTSSGVTNNNIPITKLNMDDITGTLAGGDSKLVNIVCDPKGGCSDWSWYRFGFSGEGQQSVCNFVPTGFSCE